MAEPACSMTNGASRTSEKRRFWRLASADDHAGQSAPAGRGGKESVRVRHCFDFGEDADFDFAAGNRVGDLRAGVFFKADAQLWVLFQEIGQIVRQEGMSGMGVGPQADTAANFAT